MMMKISFVPATLLLLSWFGCTTTFVESANILAVVPFNGRSHYIVIEALLKGLAAKGHQVTVFSSFPQKKPVKNLTDIDVSYLTPTVVNGFTLNFVRTFQTSFDICKVISKIGTELCEKFMGDEKIQKLLHNATNVYDLVITEIFSTDCFVSFAHKFNTPLVSITTSVALPWTNDRVGNPDNPSYIPNYFLNYSDRMSFYQRLINTMTLVFSKLFNYYSSDIPSYQIAKKYLGENLPPLDEISRQRTSLVLTNSYFSINQPRPLVPNAIEIGGIHLQQPEPLPQEIQDMLDKAKNGFIYFSFGSVFKSASMEKHMLDAFLKAFSKLPQLIIWKFEEEIDNIPPNLIIKKWWPQRDIFGHKNIKAFITHGGLSSILEGVNAGIPILGIPLFADQPGNINNLVRRGAGIQLNLEDITFDNVYNALTRLINDKSYMENAKMMSHQFKDRPMSALENAIFWVEYVLRHKGAYHMHSTAADLPLHQLLLLDVIAFLLISFFIFLYLIYIIFKVFYSHIIKRNKTKKSKI